MFFTIGGQHWWMPALWHVSSYCFRLYKLNCSLAINNVCMCLFTSSCYCYYFYYYYYDSWLVMISSRLCVINRPALLELCTTLVTSATHMASNWVVTVLIMSPANARRKLLICCRKRLTITSQCRFFSERVTLLSLVQNGFRQFWT